MTTKLVLALTSFSLLAAACGDNLGVGDDLPGDGQPSDEQPGDDDNGPGNDGPGDELPTSGPCSMNAGIFGIDVILHASTGDVLDSGVSDSDGLVEFSECPRNAMISLAAYDEDLGWKGTTVAGVQPYSDLTVVLPGVGWKGTLMAEVPEDGADITNEFVTIARQCTTSTEEGANEEVPILAGCLGYDQDVLSVLAIGRIGDVWVYTHSDDINITKNGVTNVLADDMSNWTTGGAMPMTASGITGNGASFLMAWMRNGQPYRPTGWGATVEQGSISGSIPLAPSSFSKERLVGVRQYTGSASSGILRRTTASSYDFDMAQAPAFISSVDVDNDDVTRPTFFATGLPSNGDMGVFRATWDIDGTDVEWRIIFPAANMSSVRFPVLPEALEKATPTTASAVTSVNVIDTTNQDYLGMLTTGYIIDKYPQYCGELSGDAQCRFSSLQN